MGTPQPSIARMESTQAIKNLAFAQRLAEALDCTLEVRFIPKKRGRKTAAARVAETPAKRVTVTGTRGTVNKKAGNSTASNTRRKLKAQKQ